MKNNGLGNLSLIVVTLWVGALWTTSGTAYVLFQSLQDKQLAGMLAGKLFTYVAYIGLFSAFYLLIHRLLTFGTLALRQVFFWLVVTMLILVMAGHFGVQPLLAQLKASALPSDVMHTVFADRFRTWHGVASIAYLAECFLGLVLVVRAR